MLKSSGQYVDRTESTCAGVKGAIQYENKLFMAFEQVGVIADKWSVFRASSAKFPSVIYFDKDRNTTEIVGTFHTFHNSNHIILRCIWGSFIHVKYIK
jgi:hypothetical protein